MKNPWFNPWGRGTWPKVALGQGTPVPNAIEAKKTSIYGYFPHTLADDLACADSHLGRGCLSVQALQGNTRLPTGWSN